jgi:creatinine amidohydrolase
MGVIYPFGALEQHGRHLPLGTDIFIVDHVANEAASRASALACVAPCMPVGCSEHHLGMPGSHTIRSETMTAYVKDTVRSARLSGFAWALLLNGHGGNRGIIETAAAEAVGEEPAPVVAVANYWSLIPSQLLA